MTAPAQPGEVRGETWTALTDQLVEHDWVLMRARLGVGELPSIDRLRSAALGELAVGAAIVARVWESAWPTVVEGLAYGVPLADLAAALDTSPPAVAAQVRRWMRRQHSLGRLNAVGVDEIEALVADAENAQ